MQAGRVAEAAGLRSGPDRGQAGPKPEAAGLVAGPGRALGRASFGTGRPAGRLRPTPRPGRGERRRRRGKRPATTRMERRPVVSSACKKCAVSGGRMCECLCTVGRRRTKRACASRHGRGGDRRHPARMRGHRGGGGGEGCPGGARTHQGRVRGLGGEGDGR